MTILWERLYLKEKTKKEHKLIGSFQQRKIWKLRESISRWWVVYFYKISTL